MLTSVPLLYGTYTVMRGTGTFSLEPPLSLNLEGGWPLFKEQAPVAGEMHYTQSDRERRASSTGSVAIPGFARRAERPPTWKINLFASRLQSGHATANCTVQPKKKSRRKSDANSKRASWLKATEPRTFQRPATPIVVAEKSDPCTGAASASADRPNIAASCAAEKASSSSPAATQSAPEIALAHRFENPQYAPNRCRQALLTWAQLASTRVAEVGKLFRGKCHSPSDCDGRSQRRIADRGTAGERIYLKGQFVVNFFRRESRRAPTAWENSPDRFCISARHRRASSSSPNRLHSAAPESTVSRDESRPLEITEVRKQEDDNSTYSPRDHAVVSCGVLDAPLAAKTRFRSFQNILPGRRNLESWRWLVRSS